MGYYHGGRLWVYSEGGPLILLEQARLSSWKGTDPPGTDYNRACAIADYIARIEVDGGHALVLGDEPMQTAWWPKPDGAGGVLVRWQYADDEATITQALHNIPDELFHDSDCVLEVDRGPLYLFDSAYAGAELGDHLRIEMPPGRYRVGTGLFEPDDQTSLVLHRLTRVA